ncbi:MAG: acyl-ACP desaturase [Microthrixaceae bacterium]|nr:acyl-ACP desaturase [Acidimicrobiales bacterium]MCB9403478.1 acyl-ACP desaturase [Microthrixaceae bacterium]
MLTLSPEQTALLNELEPVAAGLLDKHLSTAKEWFPHEIVPWGRGRDFAPGEQWNPDEVDIDPAVRSSLFVNLLTEDNLPYYFRTIETMFGADSAWGTWVRRWTAEEGRHSIVLRDYLTVTRLVDPVALERARMAQVESGQVPSPDYATDGIVYVTLQELATRIAHHNTGKLLDDPAGYEVMKRMAADENRHHLFYRDLGTAALEIDPSAMVIAIERQVREFEMPGTGIVDFETHAHAIARIGIYDFSVHHDSVLVPVIIRQWGIDQLEGLSPEAEEARTKLFKRMERIARAGRRFATRRDEDRASLAVTAEPALVAAR